MLFQVEYNLLREKERLQSLRLTTAWNQVIDFTLIITIIVMFPVIIIVITFVIMMVPGIRLFSSLLNNLTTSPPTMKMNMKTIKNVNMLLISIRSREVS